MKVVKKIATFLVVSSAIVPGLCSASDSSLEEAKYSLYSNYVKNNEFNVGNVSVSLLDVSAWSDTGGSNDDILQSAKSVIGYSNCGNYSAPSCIQEIGYGMENYDRNHGTEYDSHSVDNYDDKGWDDFDMFLFTFDQEVVLTGAGYTYKHGSNGEKEMSVIGLNDISMFGNNKSTTWSDVAVASNVLSSGHFGIAETAGDLYSSNFTNLSAAKYWLVGAYNTFFDGSSSALFDSSTDGVGFKLSSLTIGLEQKMTQPPTDVDEPGALALMGLGLGLVLYRRKRRV
ncbi:exosortase-dependent surface protein XDP1 [Alteromonas macleodii]|uniref:exosortase-dependent surface protein XDP1 n=1 Tax=Alteromonas macleodii TaxID=28108 RepID=UPI001927B84C|nr:exosortase-dependent surface protein XDP1 [Alteromonas macleodii]MBL3812529.1 PEP-CTERM sorting domain-containing protein [Alteromonas macleodii]MBL3886088.1 PEP-CTERM sorting domain-containing protein [Alteromonas macleodii]